MNRPRPRRHPPQQSAANSPAAHDAARLFQRVVQLEDTLLAIRSTDIDALYVAGAAGERLFTLDGADKAYRLLIEEMGEGALTLTAAGIVAYANTRFSAMVGEALHHIIGSHVERWFAPEGEDTLAGVVSVGHPVRRRAEIDLVRPDGTRMPCMISVSPLAVEGLDTALCMVVTDLTERKHGEASARARQTLLAVVEDHERTAESLRQSLAKLSSHDSALGAISQGVLITDAQRRTTYVNAAFEDICGYSAADVMGHSCD